MAVDLLVEDAETSARRQLEGPDASSGVAGGDLAVRQRRLEAAAALRAQPH
jgi:hypothetical protein